MRPPHPLLGKDNFESLAIPFLTFFLGNFVISNLDTKVEADPDGFANLFLGNYKQYISLPPRCV